MSDSRELLKTPGLEIEFEPQPVNVENIDIHAPISIQNLESLEQRLAEIAQSNDTALAINQIAMQLKGQESTDITPIVDALTAILNKPAVPYRFKIERDGRGQASEIIAEPI